MALNIDPEKGLVIAQGLSTGTDYVSDDYESHDHSALLVCWDVTQCGGAGATGTASIASGAVTGVTVTAGGTGYPNSGPVTFSGGGGSGAAGTYTAVSGVIQSVVIDTAGTGYTTPPTPAFGTGLGSDYMVMEIQGKDEASGKYYKILDSPHISTVGFRQYRVHPMLTDATNSVAKDFIPRVFRLVISETGGTASFIFSLYYSLIP